MKTYCFKLYKSKRNKKLHRQIDTAERIYNHLIALHKRYYRLYGKHLNIYKLQKHITKLKRPDGIPIGILLALRPSRTSQSALIRGTSYFIEISKQE